jgi:hypothetical protein
MKMRVVFSRRPIRCEKLGSGSFFFCNQFSLGAFEKHNRVYLSWFMPGNVQKGVPDEAHIARRSGYDGHCLAGNGAGRQPVCGN